MKHPRQSAPFFVHCSRVSRPTFKVSNAAFAAGARGSFPCASTTTAAFATLFSPYGWFQRGVPASSVRAGTPLLWLVDVIPCRSLTYSSPVRDESSSPRAVPKKKVWAKNCTTGFAIPNHGKATGAIT